MEVCVFRDFYPRYYPIIFWYFCEQFWIVINGFFPISATTTHSKALHVKCFGKGRKKSAPIKRLLTNSVSKRPCDSTTKRSIPLCWIIKRHIPVFRGTPRQLGIRNIKFRLICSRHKTRS